MKHLYCRQFLAELANFEWTQGLCFDAADSQRIFSLQDMAIIAPESWPMLSFQFHPSVRWLDLNWNAPPYWVALDNNETTPEKLSEDNPTRWLMWRRNNQPNWRSLEVTEAWSIEAAKNGANFAEICEGLLEWLGEESIAITAAGFLKQWINDELIVNINASDARM